MIQKIKTLIAISELKISYMITKQISRNIYHRFFDPIFICRFWRWEIYQMSQKSTPSKEKVIIKIFFFLHIPIGFRFIKESNNLFLMGGVREIQQKSWVFSKCYAYLSGMFKIVNIQMEKIQKILALNFLLRYKKK